MLESVLPIASFSLRKTDRLADVSSSLLNTRLMTSATLVVRFATVFCNALLKSSLENFPPDLFIPLPFPL